MRVILLFLFDARTRFASLVPRPLRGVERNKASVSRARFEVCAPPLLLSTLRYYAHASSLVPRPSRPPVNIICAIIFGSTKNWEGLVDLVM